VWQKNPHGNVIRRKYMPIELGKKVSELSGAELDFWAGKANGENVRIIGTRVNGKCYRMHGPYLMDEYSPSTDWSQGGPIIERERLMLMPWVQTNREEWASRRKDDWHKQGDPSFGQTPLTAAMRAYVASKFGEEVTDET
jgi:hypothetical protein